VPQQSIAITSFASISPLGNSIDDVWSSYLSEKSAINHQPLLTADLSEQSQVQVNRIARENKKYKALDKTVLYSLYTARQAFEQSGWRNDSTIGINIGSSRGATELFEKYHTLFVEQQRAETLTSPTTTLGNISSWLAHDLQVNGPVISHSITCASALHGFLNGIAWINAGMADKFIVGGSEAANTPFTVAQMQALNIYSRQTGVYPCRSLDFEKKENTMVLGEGATAFCIEAMSNTPHIAKIIGYGYATEQVNHNASISTNADCFQKSMQMALSGHDLDNIDAIIMHAPGTIKGDQSELNAIRKVFGNQVPALTSNKWKLGHALGASGGLSVEMAILMLQHQTLVESPFYKNEKQPNQLNSILVNAVGFGGNAVSLLVSK